jgi:hypothetical protein
MLKSSIKIVKEKFRIISLIFLFFCAPFIHEIDAAPTSWTVDYLNNPAPGYVRIEMSYFMLFDNYGSRRFIDSSGVGVNSQYALLKNGNTLESATNKMYVRNNNNIKIDSIPYTTGLDLDFHDVIVLNNGHYLILYYEYYTKDMSQIVQGGHVNANVMANVLVETDRTGSVFWMWHARDHYNITDVTEDIDLSQENIDFTHINSMYEDIDGNILVSVRHLDEVSKINKSTGAFMYRIGGTTCANNEFQFTNDTRDNFQGFSHQHSISLLSNGNLLMFDNGNMKPQPYSRAVEYSINATTKTAGKVWEYINPSSNLTAAMGSVSRLPNGNTIVNWSDRITEVRPDLTKTFEMFSTDNSLIYKAFRVTDKIADVTKLINANGYYDFNETNENTGVKIQMTSIAGSSKTSVEKHSYAPPEAGFLDTSFTGLLPYRWVVSNAGLTHIEGKIFINLSGLTGIKSGSKLAIYFRDRESKGIFTELPTTFSQTANDITANITGFGEFCIGTKVLGTQTVIYPKNNQYSLPKSFTYKWDKLQSAKYYQIQISNNSAFTDLVQNQTNLLKNEFTYDGHLENKDYYWRVRAINQVDTSAWSQTTLFHTVLPKPQLIFPINNENAFDKADSIKWVVSDKLSNNWLQVSKDQEFLDLAINNTKAGTSFDASRYLLNNTKYYWRVRSYRTSDTSNWSDINTFKTNFERPKLVLPVNDSINVVNSGMIKWNFVQGASKYHVQISNDSLLPLKLLYY